MKSFYLSILLIPALLSIRPGFAQESSLTSKNIQGQKHLFENGWFVVTSPVGAWEQARKDHQTSRDAYLKAIQKIQLDPQTFKDRSRNARKWQKELNESAGKAQKELSLRGEALSNRNLREGKEKFKEAWDKLVLGYVQYGKMNSDDLESLRKINKEFFKRVQSDSTDFEEALRPIRDELLTKSSVPWKMHFKEGNWKFQESYEKSGTRKNSIHGLWDILIGYVSWISEAVITPGVKSGYQNTKAIPYYTLDAISKTFIGTYNVIHSLGANIYFTTKLGYRLVSPSLEAGYLSSIALIQTLHGGISGSALKSAGLINKVSVKSAAPILSKAQLLIEEVASKTQDAATVIIYGAEGVSEVIAEKSETAVALSYSALSQIPPQLLLTAANSAIFLVYDGPRLILTKISGKMGDTDVREIPVGTVIDLDKARELNLKIENLSEDPETIKKVLENVE